MASDPQIDPVLRELDDIKTDVKEVLEHVKATNGRVRTLELWRAGVEGAKSAMGWRTPLAIATLSGVTVTILTRVLGG